MCSCMPYATPVKCFFTKAGLQKTQILKDIKQRKGEAEMAQIDWLFEYSRYLQADDEAVASIVTSGDIDSVIIHLYTVSRCWPRKEDRTFKNPVYVILQKPSGSDVYNITAIVVLLEKHYNSQSIVQKIALML